MRKDDIMSYFNYLNKQIYYEEFGSGDPLILLHGNTVSSKIFESFLNLYQDKYRIILVDFLGHGRSQRLKSFSTDFWYDQAMQIITLIEKNDYKNVSIIGVSGGAIAAINVGLEAPSLVKKIVADSFAGEYSSEALALTIEEDRARGKNNDAMVNFWKYNHGELWEQIIDNDTVMIIKNGRKQTPFFHKKLDELRVPILFIASCQDELLPDAEKITLNLSNKVKNGSFYLFKTGGHPTMISNAIEFSKISKKFLVE